MQYTYQHTIQRNTSDTEHKLKFKLSHHMPQSTTLIQLIKFLKINSPQKLSNIRIHHQTNSKFQVYK